MQLLNISLKKCHSQLWGSPPLHMGELKGWAGQDGRWTQEAHWGSSVKQPQEMKYNVCAHWSSWKNDLQGQEMRRDETRCTKGTSKSPQALPSLKHTKISLPFNVFSQIKKLQQNKWHWISHLSLLGFFFQIRRKKTCSKIITSLILTYLIATCWNDNLHATRDV